MLLWNYLITPIYQKMPREAIVDLLLPVFLPFNAVKGGMNLAATLLLYKPVVTALRRAKLIPESDHAAPPVAGKKRLASLSSPSSSLQPSSCSPSSSRTSSEQKRKGAGQKPGAFLMPKNARFRGRPLGREK